MRKWIRDLDGEEHSKKRVDFDKSGDDFTLQRNASLVIDRLGLDTKDMNVMNGLLNPDGSLKWPNDKLKCSTKDCKNFPMWKCDSKKMFLRNI